MGKPTLVRNTIRTLRFARGEMTQAELADEVGVTRQTIIAIEQGKYSPSLEMAFRIARVFDAPLEDVFQYPDVEVAAAATVTKKKAASPSRRVSLRESLIGRSAKLSDS